MLWEQHHRESDSIKWFRKWSQSFGTSYSFTFLFFRIYSAMYVERHSPKLMSRIIKIQILPQPYFNFKSNAYKRETVVMAQVGTHWLEWQCLFPVVLIESADIYSIQDVNTAEHFAISILVFWNWISTDKVWQTHRHCTLKCKLVDRVTPNHSLL